MVPDYNNTPISTYPEWCSSLISLNKIIGLHGVVHSYREFNTERDEEYLNSGIEEFEKCLGFRPTMFKAPQLEISQKNKEVIISSGLELKGHLNQITHKVYHCNDSDRIKNWMVDLF